MCKYDQNNLKIVFNMLRSSVCGLDTQVSSGVIAATYGDGGGNDSP